MESLAVVSKPAMCNLVTGCVETSTFCAVAFEAFTMSKQPIHIYFRILMNTTLIHTKGFKSNLNKFTTFARDFYEVKYQGNSLNDDSCYEFHFQIFHRQNSK